MEVAVAGAAVGATIKVVMENLLSFPVEEISQLWNFKEDLQKLKRSVTMILDFLEDAEMKQVTDKPVNRWLQKLDTLAFPSKKAMQGLTKLNRIDIINCPLLKQNLEKDSAAASDDSEWSKISHIPTINLDLQPFSAPSN